MFLDILPNFSFFTTLKTYTDHVWIKLINRKITGLFFDFFFTFNEYLKL